MASSWRELLNYAEFLRDSGCLYLEPGPDGKLPELASGKSSPESSPQSVPTAMKSPSSASTDAPPRRAPFEKAQQSDLVQMAVSQAPLDGKNLNEAERIKLMEGAKKKVAACVACELCRQRTQTVYGVGSPMAKIVFLGEAPGEEEDRTGIPFVGRAGQLLTKMIEAIGFKRDEVYICNTVKCRPPGNRNPLPGEKKACEHFLNEQIQWIRPQILVGLGAHAALYLTGVESSLGKMRKRWHAYRGIPVLVTYHPSFLLRSPSYKTQAWEDLMMLNARYAELNPDDPRKVWQKVASKPQG